MRGNSATGLVLVACVGMLVGIVVLFGFSGVLIASLRWVFRKSGVAAIWRKVGKQVLAIGQFLFWIGFVVLVLVGVWPYLSLDPVKSWYALTHEVPVERVEIEKKPHDCEFTTAPIGSKHCHYDAKVFVLKAADSADGKKSLSVSFERVED